MDTKHNMCQKKNAKWHDSSGQVEAFCYGAERRFAFPPLDFFFVFFV
jgi:hypothetical protein